MNWISLPSDRSLEGAAAVAKNTNGDEVSQLEAILKARVAAHVEKGDYRNEDIRYVGDVSFLPVKDRLQVTPQVLERLRRLCQLWDVDLAPPREISSHRKLIGPLIVAAKRCMFPILNVFLKETLRRQRDFNAQVVVTLAEIASKDSRTVSRKEDSGRS